MHEKVSKNLNLQIKLTTHSVPSFFILEMYRKVMLYFIYVVSFAVVGGLGPLPLTLRCYWLCAQKSFLVWGTIWDAQDRTKVILDPLHVRHMPYCYVITPAHVVSFYSLTFNLNFYWFTIFAYFWVCGLVPH